MNKQVAIITDQHFGVRDSSAIFLDSYEKFYDEIFFPTLEKENIDTVLILGDTFDKRTSVNFYTLSRAKSMFFEKLKKYNVYMIIGNHDAALKSSNKINSPELLLTDYSNITVISEPNTLKIKDVDIFFSPWICKENYDDTMQKIDSTVAKICVGHFEISGFSMYRGMQSEEGLSQSLFDKFDLTFSGHYHHKSKKGKIQYLGNPYHLTWSDYGDDRGFHLFDLETNKLKFIKNPNSMFVKITYNDSEIPFDLQGYDNKFYDNLKGKYVKLICEVKSSSNDFDTFITKINSCNPAELNVIENHYFFEVDESEDLEVEDTLTFLMKYIDSINDESITNEKLKLVMQKLYNDAISMEK